MQALVVTPGAVNSTRVEEIGEPVAGAAQVPVRVLEVGVCGTDREIDHGVFGIAPEHEETLVIGHELLGVVERDGHGFSRGDLVAATVRRSCRRCVACDEGSPDSCLTGDYRERGITRLHGFARELVAEDADQLIPIPRELGRLGVLAEPTSICARAIRHAREIGGRQPWQLRRALVIGAGAIGLLTTYLLRLAGRRGLDGVSGAGERARRGGRRALRRRRRHAAVRARPLRPRGRGRRQRAADGGQPRPAPPQRRRLPPRHRHARADRRRRRARHRARHDPREPRPLRQRQRAPAGLARGRRGARSCAHDVAGSARVARSAFARRSTASRRRSRSGAGRRRSSWSPCREYAFEQAWNRQFGVRRPERIVCVGRNYAAHAEEEGAELPAAPLLFAKLANTVVGPGDPIVLPAESSPRRRRGRARARDRSYRAARRARPRRGRARGLHRGERRQRARLPVRRRAVVPGQGLRHVLPDPAGGRAARDARAGRSPCASCSTGRCSRTATPAT